MVSGVVATKIDKIQPVPVPPPEEPVDTEELVADLKAGVKDEIKKTAADLAQVQDGVEPDVDGTGMQDEFEDMPDAVLYTEFPSYKDNAAVQGFSGCYDMIADRKSQTGFSVTEIPTPSEIVPRGFKRPSRAKMNNGLLQPRAVVEPRPGVTPLVDTPNSRLINTGSVIDTNDAPAVAEQKETPMDSTVVKIVEEAPRVAKRSNDPVTASGFGQGFVDIAKGIAVL